VFGGKGGGCDKGEVEVCPGCFAEGGLVKDVCFFFCFVFAFSFFGDLGSCGVLGWGGGC
jgi:hypothetical protein